MATTVRLSAKLYRGATWTSMRRDSDQPIQTAAVMLSRWAELYGKPEASDAQHHATFRFRDGTGVDVLITIWGATVADLRAAYRDHQSVPTHL